ncbi:unnamed protein product [Mesocestoides corti]|uniref:RIIa domain-containing protein n=1 Tax=Mesocestoides corti TaxID=53468 RepID=A0A158QU69_MESCO|nr:unnamed protein product [Mesocestoides corti]
MTKEYAMQHSESDYVQRVLGEPLKDALAAIVLYQPLDPIEFLANYLRYWAVKVRDYRRKKFAKSEMERLLSIEIPWNIKVQAERAIRVEQDYLKSERIRVEEEERRRQAELKRVRELTDKKSSLSTDKMRFEVAHFVLEEVIEMGTDVVFKAWKKAELERRKAEKAAQRAAKEAEEEGEDEEEEED